jgi:hypothetical protein
MEHVPKVKDSTSLSVGLLNSFIPYGDRRRGFSGFETFPSEHGYTITNLQLNASDNGRIVSFLQSWLYFGLLAEFFGEDLTCFDYKEFIKVTPGGTTITTEELPRYVWYLQAMRRHGPRDEVLKHMHEVDKCLHLANTVLNRVARQVVSTRELITEVWSPLNVVLLSIVILAEYLGSALEKMFDWKRLTKRPELIWEFPHLETALLNAGWCAGEISRFREDCNSTCRYYLSTIDRHALQKNHERCNSHRGCLAHQIEYSTYKPRHTTNCQGLPGCKEVGPSTQDVVANIQAGGIPVVVVKKPADSASMRVEVHLAKEVPYVAISHVWSDGLGNPNRNCLNQCQLNRIQSLVNKLYEVKRSPVRFWVDTLCIPVGDDHEDLRTIAINRMAETYRVADKVLVLDNSLEYCRGDISGAEMAMRLRYSPWMTRVWTLQEGRLARELHFRFGDRFIPSNDLRDTAKANRNLSAVSEMLVRQGDDKVRANPSSMRLISALAVYEQNETMLEYSRRPPQDNPNEEEIRQTAIEMTKDHSPEQQEIRDRWMGVVQAARVELSDVDEHLREDIYTQLFCTVTINSNAPIFGVRGWGYEYVITSGKANDYDPASLFVDVCSGYRGRTTSRLEDETLCISILLGADTSQIQVIEPLYWRLRELLIDLDFGPFRRWFFDRFGVDIRNWTRECHEKRMEVLLRQVNVFPAAVIFWSCPRMPFDGWRWAPYSLLHRDLALKAAAGGRRGTLRKEGLELQVRAFRLSPLPADSAQIRGWAAGEVQSGKEAMLVIHCEHDNQETHFPWRRTWQRVRFRREGLAIPLQTTRLLSDYAKTGMIAHLAILVEESEEHNGVLVRVHETQANITFTQHIGLVERVTTEGSEELNGRAIHVLGVWIPNHIWCVG